jgi:gp16 family phage-associated protein
MSAEEIKRSFQQRGITFTEWASANGYTRGEVYRVLNGQAKAHYGKAHDIAVKLGLKPAPAQLNA